ncbi:MarR family [Mycobacterium tuberculosis]|nr:MarR family [Mycobacterium tuberculosis]
MAANTTTVNATATDAQVPAMAPVTAPTAPTTPAVPADVSGDGAVVFGAVATTPGVTVPALATETGLTRAVVKDALTELVAAGYVTRTPGAKGANTDTWSPVPVASSDGIDAEATAGVSADTIAAAMKIMQDEADRRAVAEADLQKAIADEEARRAQAVAELARRQTAEATRRALSDLIGAATTAYAAVAAEDDGAMTAGLDRVYAAAAEVRRATKTTVRSTGTPAGSGNGNRNGGHRAAPRPLRPEVIAHLSAHPDTDFTPGEIGRVLERSSGAVANALATMAERGEAVMTSEKPVRYRSAAPVANGGGESGDVTA